MTTNTELFRKYMMFSRKLRMSAVDHAVGKGPRPDHFPPHPPMPPMEPGMCPPPRPFPGMSPEEMPEGMPEGMPPRGPHGHHGPHRRRMSREHLLVLLNEHPDGLWQKKMAEEAGINASSASEVVNKLEEDGYLMKVTDETDRRATRLILTEAGKARAEEIRAEREAALDDVFSKLSDEEKETLSALLDKLLS
ncbi:MAG: MarR family transcriptional regulator [Solobacterium sp.]|nr:MarR family transcriptional regulator [Solobacterium sp.]